MPCPCGRNIAFNKQLYEQNFIGGERRLGQGFEPCAQTAAAMLAHMWPSPENTLPVDWMTSTQALSASAPVPQPHQQDFM